MTHLLLWGNAYAQIIRNGKGEVVALYPLMPNKMTVDRDENGQLYYTYQRSNEEAHTMEGSSVKLKPSDNNRVQFLLSNGKTEERTWKDRSRSESWTDEMKEVARQRTLQRYAPKEVE